MNFVEIFTEDLILNFKANLISILRLLVVSKDQSRGYVLQRSCEATISFKIIITVASKFNISQQNIMVQSLKAKNGLYWSFEPTSSLKILIKFALKFNVRSSVKISTKFNG